MMIKLEKDIEIYRTGNADEKDQIKAKLEADNKQVIDKFLKDENTGKSKDDCQCLRWNHIFCLDIALCNCRAKSQKEREKRVAHFTENTYYDF